MVEGKILLSMKGVFNVSRGEHYEHKKKGHPGEFPQGSEPVEKHSEEAIGDEELIVTREAFKNRVEDEDERRPDTGRILPKYD